MTTSTQNQKLITLSETERSLFFFNQLEQHNPTREETEAFFTVCEAYGLNPLMGDIVFQKRFVKKTNSSVASYIVTRDGHYKYALRQPNFVKLISYVVCEGDHFEIDAIAGVPKHIFGTNRGKKIGAWAMIEDKVRGCMATFVEFDEYFEANKSNLVWNSMPSAMIKKVAQVEALRIAFPLGIHFRTEFEGEGEGVIDLNADMKGAAIDSPAQEDKKAAPSVMPDLLFSEEELKAKQEEVSKRTKAETAKEEPAKKKKTSKKDLSDALLEGEKPVVEKQKEEAPKAEQPTEEAPPAVETKSEEKSNTDETKETAEGTVEQEPVATEEVSPEATVEQEPILAEETAPVVKEEAIEPVTTNEPVEPVYEFVSAKLMRSQSSQDLFLQIKANLNGQAVDLIAKGDVMDDFDQMEAPQKFTAEVIELHGFIMVKSIVLAG